VKFFISLVPDPNSTAAQQPTPEFYGIMDGYVSKALASGKVIATGAMEPIQQATVVAPVSREARVVDGPYTEAKELVAGWVLLEADSRKEAIDNASEFVQLHIDHWPGWNGHGKVQEVYY
jgi:hypothetical protein